MNSRTNLQKALNSTSMIVASMATSENSCTITSYQVNPNISLSSQDANRCIQAFGGAKSLMRLVKIMVASDGPLFVRDSKTLQVLREETSIENVRHLLLGEARTMRKKTRVSMSRTR